MLKVLIVDDELLVRIGLKSTMNWNENGFELVGEAKNAKEAIEIFDQTSPDILITDITMPGQNGLELIRLLKEKKDLLASIILTHHEDFSFAKEAISLGVIDYILKSNLTADRLKKVLSKAALHINNLQIDSYNDPMIKNNSLQAIPDDLVNIFKDYCRSPKSDHPAVEMFSREYGNRIKISIFIQVHNGSVIDEEPSENISVTYEKVFSQIRAILPPAYLSFPGKNSFEYLFICSSAEDPVLQYEKINKAFLQLCSNMKKLTHNFLTIGISNIKDGLTSLHKVYLESHSAEDQAFFNSPMICIYTNKENYEGFSQSELFYNAEKINLVLKGGEQEINLFILDLIKQVRKKKSYNLLERLFRNICEATEELLSSQLDQYEYQSRIEAIKKVFHGLEDLESVELYIRNLLNFVQDSLKNRGKIETSFIIKKSKKYIDTHYEQNISLSNLANNVEISKSYLSFLFKEELGINFTHYLTNVRIEKAKSLLTSSNLRIYEIADKVGFDSPFYFSKVFKDITGMTCKEYRKQHFE